MTFEPFNINSSYEVSSQANRLVMDRCDFLFRRWSDVPVYLVDKELMDIISPPEERIFLEPDCVRQFLGCYGHENNNYNATSYADNVFEELQEEANRFWQRLSDCRYRGFSETRAVYIRNLTTYQIQAIRDQIIVRIPFRNQFGDQPFGTQYDIANLPRLDEFSRVMSVNNSFEEFIDKISCREAIFICMERLVEASQKVRKQHGFKTTTKLPCVLEGIYACTLIHELVHAYILIDHRYNEPWGKVIEESLATAWTMKCFSDSSYYSTLKTDIALNLLLEYKGYSFFDYLNKSALVNLINAWRRNNVRDALSVFLPDQIRKETMLIYPTPSAGMVWNDQTPPKQEKTIKEFVFNPVTYWKLLARELLLHALDI